MTHDIRYQRKIEASSEKRVEWSGCGIARVGSPDGPAALYIEGDTEIIIIENLETFFKTDTMRGLVAKYAKP
jgi:hypothetical protein